MFLLTRPEHDFATRYISRWAEKVMTVAREKSHQVFDLVKDKATRNNVESYLKKQMPRLVMLNGHGSTDQVCGHNNEVLIKQGENESVLNGKIVYALSCSSLKELGPAAVDTGATAFIGYSRPFWLMGDYRYINRPLDDERAKPFLESSNSIMVSLLKGHTVKESCDKGKTIFQRYYSSLITSEATKDDINDAMALSWNMKSLSFVGEAEAKI